MDTLLAPAGLGRSAVRPDRRCHPFGVVPGRGRARRRGCGWAVDGARWGFPRQRQRGGAPGALESRSPARRCSCSQWTWRSQERVSATSATRSLAAPRPGLSSARGLDIATHPGWARDVVVNGRPLTFRQPRGSGTPSRHPGGVQRMVAPKLEPSATSDDVAWVREHFNGRLVVRVGARPGGRPSLRRRRRGWHRGLEPGRTAARLRALDRARPPDVIDAVGGRAEVPVDGGIRTALDVVEMIALGPVP